MNVRIEFSMIPNHSWLAIPSEKCQVQNGAEGIPLLFHPSNHPTPQNRSLVRADCGKLTVDLLPDRNAG